MASLIHRVIPSLIFFYFVNVRSSHIVTPEYELKFPNHSSILPPSSTEVFGNKAYTYTFWEERGSGTFEVILTSFGNEGLVSNKSCKIDIPLKEDADIERIQVHSVHNNQVILFSSKFNIPAKELNASKIFDVGLRLEVIHMDDCKFYESFVPTVNPVRAILSFLDLDIVYHENNTFDVFIPEASSKSALNKYTFNDKAERINGPVPLLPALYKYDMIKMYPFKSSNAYYAVAIQVPWDDMINNTRAEVFSSTQKIVYVKDDIVTEVAYFPISLYNARWPTASNNQVLIRHSNDLFGFCRQFQIDGDKTVDCMQFDENNKTRVHEKFVLDKSREVLAIYNVPEGLLLIEASCDNQLCHGFSLRKLDGDNTVQNLEINGSIPVSYATMEPQANKLSIALYGPSTQEAKTTVLTWFVIPNVQ